MRTTRRLKRTTHKRGTRRTVKSKTKSNLTHKKLVANLVKQRKLLVAKTLRIAKLKLNKTNRVWQTKFNALKRQFARKLHTAKLLAVKTAMAKLVRQEELQIQARAKAVHAAVTRFEKQALTKLVRKFGGTTAKKGGKKTKATKTLGKAKHRTTKLSHGKKRHTAKVLTHPAVKRHNRIRRAA